MPPQQLHGRTTEVVAEVNGGRERGDGDGNLHTFLLIRGSFYNTVPYNITTLPEDNVNLFGVIVTAQQQPQPQQQNNHNCSWVETK